MPRSWWEPEALCVCINWNDDDGRNPLFNSNTHHMVYFNISPYHLTLSMTSSLSGRMTDLFSVFSPIRLWFTLPHLGYVVQHFDSESAGLSTSLGSSNIDFPLLLSTADRLWKPLCSLSSSRSSELNASTVKHKQLSPGQSHVPCH